MPSEILKRQQLFFRKNKPRYFQFKWLLSSSSCFLFPFIVSFFINFYLNKKNNKHVIAHKICRAETYYEKQYIIQQYVDPLDT